MIGITDDCEAFFRDQFPCRWQQALTAAKGLAQRLEFLVWPDRTRVVNAYLWCEAQAQLSHDDITCVVSRQCPGRHHSLQTLEFATQASTVLTGALDMLAEHIEVKDLDKALTLRLSRNVVMQDEARDWLAQIDPEIIG